MKITHSTMNVLTNSQSESKFTINASAHAFKILSDGLYQHKIAAIVRELSCNAYDSHVAANKRDVPFRVVLPNTLHPYFEVEDFGIGLDDEGVRNVYTSYFTSTKSDSNESIGAFGLGSKTPFAYTQAFTIIARKDGVERTYAAYIGADGAPCVNMMNEQHTEAENGVKITVPVKLSDFSTFGWEARWILSFFMTKPDVPGDFVCLFPGVAEELAQHGIISRQMDDAYWSDLYTAGSVYAVMGGVCYKIDENTLSNAGGQHKGIIRTIFSANRKNAVFVNFNIGELEVAASRETLSMTDATRDSLLAVVNENLDSLVAREQEEIDSRESMLEAVKYVYSRFGTVKVINSIFSYKGDNLVDILEKPLLKSYTATLCYNYRARFNRDLGVAVEDMMSGAVTHILYTAPGESTVGLVKHARNVYLEPQKRVLVIQGISLRSLKRWLGVFGNDKIKVLHLAELRAIEKAQRVKSPNYRPSVKITKDEVKARTISLDSSAMPVEPVKAVDLTEGSYFYYEGASYCQYLEGVGSFSTSTVYNILKEEGLDDVVILLMNKGNETKIRKHNIPCLKEFLLQWKLDNQEKIDRTTLKSGSTSKLRWKIVLEAAKENEVVAAELKAGHRVGTLEEITNSRNVFDFSCEGMSSDDVRGYTITPMITKVIRVACNEYPMLNYVLGNQYSTVDAEHVRHAEDYIRAVNSARQVRQDSVTLLSLAA